jgi:hypothetical protein
MGVRSADAIGDVASRSCLSEHPAVANIKAGIATSHDRLQGLRAASKRAVDRPPTHRL